jgi:hypothetical protein
VSRRPGDIRLPDWARRQRGDRDGQQPAAVRGLCARCLCSAPHRTRCLGSARRSRPRAQSPASASSSANQSTASPILFIGPSLAARLVGNGSRCDRASRGHWAYKIGDHFAVRIAQDAVDTASEALTQLRSRRTPWRARPTPAGRGGSPSISHAWTSSFSTNSATCPSHVPLDLNSIELIYCPIC